MPPKKKAKGKSKSKLTSSVLPAPSLELSPSPEVDPPTEFSQLSDGDLRFIIQLDAKLPKGCCAAEDPAKLELQSLLPSLVGGWNGVIGQACLARGQDVFRLEKDSCKPWYHLNQKPDNWDEKQKKRPWLHWSPMYGVVCTFCAGRNLSTLGVGVKLNKIEWSNEAAKIFGRHEKSNLHIDAIKQGLIEQAKAAEETAESAMPQAIVDHPQNANFDKSELRQWFRGLYWGAQNRLSVKQIQSYLQHRVLQDSTMLATHHSSRSIRAGLCSLHKVLRNRTLKKLQQAGGYALMTDGVTEPVKRFIFIAVFVDRDSCELECAMLDLSEVEAGAMIKWEDEAGPVGNAAQDQTQFESVAEKVYDHIVSSYPPSMQWLAIDGEGAMMGCKRGLRGLLTSRLPTLVTHHCSNHSQQLAHQKAETAGIATEGHQESFNNILHDINRFLEKNPSTEDKCFKRSRKLRESHLGLRAKQLSGTRWIMRARRVRTFRRTLESRMQVFSKLAVHKKVKQKDRARLRQFLDAQRKFSSLFFAHALDDYLSLSYLKSLRLQRRFVSVGTPAREHLKLLADAKDMFPNYKDGGDIVGGEQTQGFFPELIKTGGKTWRGFEILYTSASEITECVSELNAYVATDLACQIDRMGTSSDICVALAKLELEAIVGAAGQHNYFCSDLDTTLRAQYHGLVTGTGLTWDADKALHESKVFFAMFWESVREVGESVVLRAVAGRDVKEIQFYQMRVNTVLQRRANRITEHMAFILELSRFACVSTAPAESIFSKMSILKGDTRFWCKTDLLAFYLMLMTGPSEAQAVQWNLIEEAIEDFLSSPRRTYLQQRLCDSLLELDEQEIARQQTEYVAEEPSTISLVHDTSLYKELLPLVPVAVASQSAEDTALAKELCNFSKKQKLADTVDAGKTAVAAEASSTAETLTEASPSSLAVKPFAAKCASGSSTLVAKTVSSKSGSSSSVPAAIASAAAIPSDDSTKLDTNKKVVLIHTTLNTKARIAAKIAEIYKPLIDNVKGAKKEHAKAFPNWWAANMWQNTSTKNDAFHRWVCGQLAKARDASIEKNRTFLNDVFKKMEEKKVVGRVAFPG